MACVSPRITESSFFVEESVPRALGSDIPGTKHVTGVPP